MKLPINILVAEDEPIIAADLAFTLSKMGYQVYEPLSNGKELIDFLKNKLPDLILLDINLEGPLDGIDLANHINANYGIPFIFLSSNTDEKTFSRARLANPKAFLSKPFREKDLKFSIELALESTEKDTTAGAKSDALSSPTDRIFLKVKDKMVKIMLVDILWILADNYYCWVFTKTNKYLATLSLSKLVEELNHPDFIRVNRSQVINLTKVDELDKNYIFIGKEKIQIGKSYKENVMKRFLKV